ncbi:glycosyltransferase family 4 protein [Candidatus Harpocratesius sp.]
MTKYLILANAKSYLINKWLNINKSDIQIKLISVYKKGKFMKEIDFERINFKNSAFFSYIKLLFNIRKIIKVYKPDIIFSHYLIHNGLIATFSGFHPHITVVYGSDVYKSSKISQLLAKIVLSKSDKIMVSNYATKKFLIKHYHIREKKIIVAYWGINTQIFNLKIDKKLVLEKSIFLKEFDLNPQFNYILSPRLLSPIYMHETLLYTFKLISDKYPEFKFIFISFLHKNKSYIKNLKQITKNLNLENKIIWIDRPLSQEEMKELFLLSTVMYQIPIHDQLAATLLEGIACGCFPIVCDNDSYYEVIHNHKNGIIVKNRNPKELFFAFEEFLENKEYFKNEIKKTSNHIIETYPEEKYSEIIQSLFESYKV